MNQGGIGMIPYSKILAYAAWIDFNDTTQFLKIIQAVDADYIDRFYKKINTK
jgi:hypothetical protein